MIDNITLITIISLTLSFIIILIKLILKSKCFYFKCCGLEIKRDINKEIDIEKYRIDHNIKDDENIMVNDIIKK